LSTAAGVTGQMSASDDAPDRGGVMREPKNVVVGLDGSTESDAALV
jgi:hypothetical protein